MINKTQMKTIYIIAIVANAISAVICAISKEWLNALNHVVIIALLWGLILLQESNDHYDEI
jgi:hypothetical protein|nr:MAG TPA: hypothetical protein [Caudoviricetes sp.]